LAAWWARKGLGVRRLVVVGVLVALWAAPARAGGPSMLVGAFEELVKEPTLEGSQKEVALVQRAGLDAVIVSSTWQLGETAPSPLELTKLKDAAKATALARVRLLVTVYPSGSSQTPLTDEARADFARYAGALARLLPSVRDFIVGNEPNLNRYWLPQFNPDGSDAAAPAYEALLAATYDALKTVSAAIRVIGVAVSPRGGDLPNTGRATHSPTRFIADLGAAYRSSGRTAPIMDAFAVHPYEDNSSIAPGATHPNTTTIAIADYGKLVQLLGQAFDGTAQPGSSLPLLYTEFGVETTLPAAQAGLYGGIEPPTTHPVDEATQGSYYRQAFALAFCQPTVQGIFLLHTVDERPLDRWQSGVYYANGLPKSDLPKVAAAAGQVHRGVVAGCPGMQLAPHAIARFPRGAQLRARRLRVSLRCDIDCVYDARLERLPVHSATLETRGSAIGGAPTQIVFPPARPAPGVYRLVLRLVPPLNPGPPRILAKSFRLRSRTR
jgi:hypothetical protein